MCHSSWEPHTNGNLVIIVNANEIPQLQVTRKTGSFTGNALHGAAITKEAVGMIGEEVVTGLVEDGGSVSLGNGQTNGVAETLAQRAGGDFNTGGVISLGVAGSETVELSEMLQVLDGQFVTEQMKEGILKHASVTVPIQNILVNDVIGIRRACVRENKTITIRPVRVTGIEAHELVEENVSGRGQAHRRTGMTGVCVECGIDL